MFARIGTYFLERFREPSTWRGVILLLTAFGVAIKPQMAQAIVTLGLALAGGAGVVTPDRMRDPSGDQVPTGADPAPDIDRRSPFLDHD